MPKPDKAFFRTVLTAVLFYLLALLLRRLDLSFHLFHPDTGMLSALIFIGLFSAWGVSVRRRIIQPAARKYLTGIAALIVLWMSLRTCRFFFLYVFPTVNRLCWYTYYAPMLLIPLLGLLAAVCLGMQEDYRLPRGLRLLPIPVLALLLAILTNDLHQQAFVFPQGLAAGAKHYGYGLLYWIAVGWIGLAELSELLILLHKCRRPGARGVLWLPIAPYGLAALYTAGVVAHAPLTSHWDVTLVLCTLLVLHWESCIQCGLIRSNTRYEALFRASTVAMQIVDRDAVVRYASETARSLPAETLRLAERCPVALDRDTRLRGAAIAGGYVLWQDDLTAVNALLSELQEVGARLEENNALLSAEVALKKRRARIDEQNRLYDAIARDLEPRLRLLTDALEGFSPEDADARDKLARLCVVSAYVKRRTNLVLLGEDARGVQAEELTHSIRESVDYLRVRGAACSFESRVAGTITAPEAELVYDVFESAVEAALPSLRSLLVNLDTDRDGLTLKMVLDGACAPFPPERDRARLEAAGAVLSAETAEGETYLSLRLPKGGGAVC